MKNTPHFTLSALQANDAHSYMAEKRNILLSCNPTLTSLRWFTLRPLLIQCCLLSIVHLLILFNFRKTWCYFTLGVRIFLFLSSWIHFLIQILSVSPGNLQLPNSRWHPKYTSGPVSYCFPRPSLWTVIKCGFPSSPEPHIQMYVPHSHILYTHNNATSQTGAHPLVSALTPLAPCHLPKAQTPLTHFSLEPHTETRHQKRWV